MIIIKGMPIKKAIIKLHEQKFVPTAIFSFVFLHVLYCFNTVEIIFFPRSLKKKKADEHTMKMVI